MPTQIEQEGFEVIRNEMVENTDKYQLEFSFDQGNPELQFKILNVVDHCYALDTNAEPNVYKLKDLNEIIMLHLNERKAKRIDNKYMKELWTKLEKQLIKLFQDAALKCEFRKEITKEFQKKFFCSGKNIMKALLERKIIILYENFCGFNLK